MSQAPRPIIIDCDPGQDDAVMLLFAMACPEALSVLGVSAVAGNVPLALTQRNARLMCELAGRADIPVYAGHERPLQRPLITAENVHGRTGIDGAPVAEPAAPLATGHAVDFMIRALEAAEPGTVTLVATGPLTNVADLYRRRPDLLGRIQQVVIMGGALREGGNTTPSAEFNMLVDPEAAHIVLGGGRPVTMAPLDVSHRVPVRRSWLDALRKRRSPVAAACVGMLEYFNRHDSAKYGTEGAPLHDPCTIAWLLEPDLFQGKPCNVEVETGSRLTRGHTAVDFWGVSGREANVLWLHDVDADGFFELLLNRLDRYES